MRLERVLASGHRPPTGSMQRPALRRASGGHPEAGTTGPETPAQALSPATGKAGCSARPHRTSGDCPSGAPRSRPHPPPRWGHRPRGGLSPDGPWGPPDGSPASNTGLLGAAASGYRAGLKPQGRRKWERLGPRPREGAGRGAKGARPVLRRERRESAAHAKLRTAPPAGPTHAEPLPSCAPRSRGGFGVRAAPRGGARPRFHFMIIIIIINYYHYYYDLLILTRGRFPRTVRERGKGRDTGMGRLPHVPTRAPAGGGCSHGPWSRPEGNREPSAAARRSDRGTTPSGRDAFARAVVRAPGLGPGRADAAAHGGGWRPGSLFPGTLRCGPCAERPARCPRQGSLGTAQAHSRGPSLCKSAGGRGPPKERTSLSKREAARPGLWGGRGREGGVPLAGALAGVLLVAPPMSLPGLSLTWG